jgi:ankyrin repeat protein
MTTDSDAVATIAAIRNGDLAELQRLLRDNPGLAASRLKIAKGRTPLHVVSDWPGYFPSGPRVAKALIDAGAVVDVRSTNDEHGETPLHWTASSDDADVARVLIEAGADIEIPEGSIGTPLDSCGCGRSYPLDRQRRSPPLLPHGAPRMTRRWPQRSRRDQRPRSQRRTR